MPISFHDATEVMQAATIDIWNCANRTERRKLMEKYFSPHIKAYAPDGSETVGYDACDRTWEGLHTDGRQKWWFKKSGDIWVNGNIIMQFWTFGHGDEGWKGWDVIIVDEHKKVTSLYGLVEGMHNHSAELKDLPNE